MDKEKFAESHCEKLDNLASTCSTFVFRKVEQIMGRNLSTSERDEILEELKNFCKLIEVMQLLDIVTHTEKEKQNESERPSNTLS